MSFRLSIGFEVKARVRVRVVECIMPGCVFMT